MPLTAVFTSKHILAAIPINHVLLLCRGDNHQTYVRNVCAVFYKRTSQSKYQKHHLKSC